MSRSRSHSKRRHNKQASRDRDHKHINKKTSGSDQVKKHDQKKKHTRKQRKQNDSSSSSRSSSSLSSIKSQSEDAGHYDYSVGQTFKHDKYELTKFLCDGTFGRVVEVKSRVDNKYYAMKIIRAVDRYVESAKTEEEILRYLQARDPNKNSHIVRFIEAFERKQNYCMIFERLGVSLYELLKKNEFSGFPIKFVQSMFRQMLQALAFMHSLKITHTDLKPENILVCSTELIKSKVSSRSTTHDLSESEEHTKTFYLPLTDEIKIIDMGGATFSHEHHSAIINTRQYRAPEVVLGCTKWDQSSDVWGIACIVIELCTGELFFSTRKSDYEHLAMIEKACGPIPYWMVYRTSPPHNKHFSLNDKHFQKYNSYYTWPHTTATTENIQRVQKMKNIQESVSQPLLVQLLKKMLQVEPQHRITCAQALQHPFFLEDYN